jgi:hypothetical protein
MFRYIGSSDVAKLSELAPELHETSSNVYAFICFDHSLSLLAAADGTTAYKDVSSIFRVFPRYHRHLSIDIRPDSAPPADHNYERVFGFRYLEKNVLLPKSTFLYRCASQNNQLSKEVHEDGFIIAEEEFSAFFTASLSNRTRQRVYEAVEKAQKFAPSLSFTTRRECRKIHRDSFCLHIGPHDATLSWYNARIESLMLQCRMLQIVSPITEPVAKERYAVGLSCTH